MHLLIDIGNSTVVVAVTDDSGAIFKTWRYKTLKDQTMAYYRHELYTGSKKYKIDFSQISRVFISSVVPEVGHLRPYGSNPAVLLHRACQALYDL